MDHRRSPRYPVGEDRRETTETMATAARRLIDFLAAQGIDRAFCVPGESYIALLDALHAHPRMDLVTCRSEGGAGFMAVADAKLGLVGGFGMVTYDRCLCTGAVILGKSV